MAGASQDDPETSALVRGFEEGTLTGLPHADHVRLAWAYARSLPLVDAITRMREGLVRFVTARGVPEKYNETITWAFMTLVNERVARAPEASWAAFAVEHTDLFDMAILRARYLPETLASPLARHIFLLPDAPRG